MRVHYPAPFIILNVVLILDLFLGRGVELGLHATWGALLAASNESYTSLLPDSTPFYNGCVPSSQHKRRLFDVSGIICNVPAHMERECILNNLCPGAM